MKGELAARAVAVAALARDGQRPAGDVVLVAEADEESNTSDVGMSWLVREREDLRCDFALNEGGGILLELADGRRMVTVSVGEKRVDLAAPADLRACRACIRPGAGRQPGASRGDRDRAAGQSRGRAVAGTGDGACPPRPGSAGRRRGCDRLGRRPAPVARGPASWNDPDDGHAYGARRRSSRRT